MKLYKEFITACEQSKLKMLTKSGVWLGYRNDEWYSYILYDLDGVYVEVKICNSTTERCYYLFTDTAGLDLYLDMIEIPFSNPLT